MAERARLTITVTSSRNNSTVQIRSNGAYKGLVTNSQDHTLTGLPLMGTVSESAFWLSVLPYVSGNV
jgi:hypothetical protein